MKKKLIFIHDWNSASFWPAITHQKSNSHTGAINESDRMHLWLQQTLYKCFVWLRTVAFHAIACSLNLLARMDIWSDKPLRLAPLPFTGSSAAEPMVNSPCNGSVFSHEVHLVQSSAQLKTSQQNRKRKDSPAPRWALAACWPSWRCQAWSCWSDCEGRKREVRQHEGDGRWKHSGRWLERTN